MGGVGGREGVGEGREELGWEITTSLLFDKYRFKNAKVLSHHEEGEGWWVGGWWGGAAGEGEGERGKNGEVRRSDDELCSLYL